LRHKKNSGFSPKLNLGSEIIFQYTKVIKKNPYYDCIGFEGKIIFVKDGSEAKFIHSIKNN
jgi:hypothetical protein